MKRSCFKPQKMNFLRQWYLNLKIYEWVSPNSKWSSPKWGVELDNWLILFQCQEFWKMTVKSKENSYRRVFKVANYKSVVRFTKFKIADRIRLIYLRKKKKKKKKKKNNRVIRKCLIIGFRGLRLRIRY